MLLDRHFPSTISLLMLYAICSYSIEIPLPVDTDSAEDDASDSESDEDTSSKTAVILPSSSSAIPREIISSNTTIKFEPPGSRDESEDEGENDKVDEVDEGSTQSHNSSSRDSRSPITFNESPKSGATSKPRSPSPASASSSEDEEMEDEVESDNDSSENEEAPKAIKKADRTEVSQVDGASSDPDNASNSEDYADLEHDSAEESDEEDNPEPEVQVPKSSQTLPPHKHFVKPASSKLVTKPSQNNSKGSLLAMSLNTQDEVDQQLTSSIYEARSSPSSSISRPIPASSAAVKPKMGIGASLSSLLASKSNLTQSSAAKINGVTASSQKLQLAQQEEDEEESEEESEDDDDGSSDEEVEVSKSRTSALKTSKPSSQKQNSQKDSDDSDSNSDSESDVDDEEQTRRDLLSQINAVQKDGGTQVSIPSPQAFRSGTQNAGSAKKVEKKKASDRYLTNYHFKPPA